MDAFTKTVLLSAIVALGVFGLMVTLTINAIDQANIPDVQRGTVLSKQPTSDNPLSSFAINLSDGKTLYIKNNSTLYDNILTNKTYIFNCLLDFNHKIDIIETVSELK